MDTSSDESLAQQFVRRAAETLIQKHGLEEVRRILLARLSTLAMEDRRLFLEMLMIVDKMAAKETESNSECEV